MERGNGSARMSASMKQRHLIDVMDALLHECACTATKNSGIYSDQRETKEFMAYREKLQKKYALITFWNHSQVLESAWQKRERTSEKFKGMLMTRMHKAKFRAKGSVKHSWAVFAIERMLQA